MPQLAFAGGLAVGDVAQAVDRTQLTEKHGHQLAPTAETLGVAFGSVLAGGRRSRSERKSSGTLAASSAAKTSAHVPGPSDRMMSPLREWRRIETSA
jgi:hypothetical protein